MTPQEIRRITLEEYIEANGGMASFLDGLHSFAKANGFDWLRELQSMMTDVEHKASLFSRLGVRP